MAVRKQGQSGLDGDGQGLPLPLLARRACSSLSEVTGLRVEGVTALEPDEDGAWKVTVEVLERAGVPETDDVIGSYETEVDEKGELLDYRRLRRYRRGDLDPEHPGADLGDGPVVLTLRMSRHG